MGPVTERKLTIDQQAALAPKPEWIKSLEAASGELRIATDQKTPEMIDAKTRIAYAWMDIARIQKGDA